MATVVDLITYPVKGCAGVSATRTRLTPAGLDHDRSFMVVTDGGVFRSQRTDPRLAVIQPQVDSEGRHLTLHAPGTRPLRVEVTRDGATHHVEMFQKPYRGVDQGEAAAEWLFEVLGAASRLVRVPPDHDRLTDGLTPGTSGYADSSAVHVVSRATHADLNARIAAAGRAPLPLSRFRPNIVVESDEGPHMEDRARAVTIGEGELGFAKLAVRCAVTLVDQDTGGKAGPEPLRTLATYRRAPEGGVTFGAKFSVLRGGEIAVGEEFGVTRRADPPR